MTDHLQQVLGDTLAYLMALWRDAAAPAEALDRLHRLQEQHRHMTIDLVWERESYEQTMHYDVLLRPSDAGTISLSFCPDRAVPWPLRHAHHSRESEMVRVNGRMVTMQEVMAYVDFIWNQARVITGLVDACLVQAAITQRNIQVSADELQQALDAFRRRQRLYTAVETEHWLQQRGITHAQLEHQLEPEVAAGKLRDQIADGHVEQYFSHHMPDFDTVRVARFNMPDAEQARHIYVQMQHREVDFFTAAQQQFCADATARDGLCFAVLQRRQLSPEQAAVIFTAVPGEVTEPVRRGAGYDLVCVLQRTDARLDASTRTAIKQTLFEAWLAEQRRAATIEWFWGDVTRLPGQQPYVQRAMQ
jgi:putative peptide maturation system protein